MEKILHVFDMDDTLFETPTFADFFSEKDGENIDIEKIYPNQFLKVKSTFWDVLSKDVYFKRSGDFIVPINKETNKPFGGELIDYFNTKDLKKMFLIKNNILVLNAFNGFHSDPSTLGWIVNNPVFNDYVNAKNKMILTGRDESMRSKIMYILKFIGMEFPNYGLKLFQGKGNIEQYKINEILQSIQKHGWEIVHFYEDRLDWLSAAEKAVSETFPEVTFIAHPITNVKNKRSLNMT